MEESYNVNGRQEKIVKEMVKAFICSEKEQLKWTITIQQQQTQIL